MYIEPVAALLSKKTGRPVKVTLSRTEEFEGTGPTSGGYIKAKIGATKDGRITAAEAVFIYEAGAYLHEDHHLGQLPGPLLHA